MPALRATMRTITDDVPMGTPPSWSTRIFCAAADGSGELPQAESYAVLGAMKVHD